ncbi:IclR family transcriptional regulator [Zhihengliuella flava]|uniref:IclR family pca regulon transcriptional regulator/IclR family acetate operon transcriptional repressor n=1 Tax=Zhihengliuella flava TaxID=1285193 RepID=A0A931DA04_9MICC|nr:IclR family transcriptional regulator [Zhihengliuella flava]MBG6085089.1 IclR family pca regulon transcriptional regulator/IclR family acetate operon transcriptional repressor [Zhihengliuella flava]
MTDGTNRGRTVERALDIVDYVSTVRSPVKLSQISRETGLHLATAQRIAATLVGRGYLRTTDAGYVVGPSVLSLARAFTLQDRLSVASFPVLQGLTASSGLTSSIYVRTGDSRVLTCRVEAPQPLRYQLPIGHRLELTRGGGKVLLAFLPEADFQEVMEGFHSQELANGRNQTREDLEREIDVIRTRGYYLSVSERHLGTVSLTAPIRTVDGEIAGAVNIVAHDDTLSPEEMTELRPQLMNATRTIGEQM